mgnify:CR=1 FL=1
MTAPVVNMLTARGNFGHQDYFYWAWQEGLLRNTSIHAGSVPFALACEFRLLYNGAPRRRIRVPCDDETDNRVGFNTVTADEIEDIGYRGVIKRIRDRVGDSPVYLTIGEHQLCGVIKLSLMARCADIDTLDPAFAVGTSLHSLDVRALRLS